MSAMKTTFKVGDYVYWWNEHKERIPAIVLAVKRRVKLDMNDNTGDRVAWVEKKNVILQEP
jgi:hypothetical protein